MTGRGVFDFELGLFPVTTEDAVSLYQQALEEARERLDDGELNFPGYVDYSQWYINRFSQLFQHLLIGQEFEIICDESSTRDPVSCEPLTIEDGEQSFISQIAGLHLGFSHEESGQYAEPVFQLCDTFMPADMPPPDNPEAVFVTVGGIQTITALRDFREGRVRAQS